MFCGLCFGRGLVPPGAADLSKEEVINLFNVSTQINGGRLIVHGLFARADTKNTNGRIYPKAVLKREVKRFKVQHIKTGTALGELNHPSYYSCYFRSLNLPNISHQVLEVHWKGNELWGTIEVLPTPAGLLLWELYSRGIKLGVSSRGWASVVADPAHNRVLVDEDFQLITFDFVTEPSNAGAYLVPIHTKYKQPLPDQLRAVRASYLGFGSSDMAGLTQLPAASVLSKWLKATKKAMAAQYSSGQAQEQQAFALTATALQQPSPAAVTCSSNGAGTGSFKCHSAPETASMLQALDTRGSLCVLPGNTPLGGGVVLGSHYRVLHEPWMPVDPAGREFKVHLSLVATKAHVMQQKQQQKIAAAGGADGSRIQQQQQQQPHTMSGVDSICSGQSIPCPELQQQQPALQAAKEQDGRSSFDRQALQMQQQGMHAEQQQQQLNTRSTVRDALHTSSTTYSMFSHGSLGSQHLAAARDMLLASTNTDMSGCSLGPVVPPAAPAAAAAAAGVSGGTLQQQQQPRQRVKPRRHQSAPGSSLQPRQWDWDKQPAAVAPAKPSALQTVLYSWDKPPVAPARPTALLTVAAQPSALMTVAVAAPEHAAAALPPGIGDVSRSSSVAAMACGIPAAAAAAAAAEAAGAGELGGDVQGPHGALNAQAPGVLQDAVWQDSTLAGDSQHRHPKTNLVAVAWQPDGAVQVHNCQQQQQQQQAQRQQQQVQQQARPAQPPPGQQATSPGPIPQRSVDQEYMEIRDTLQAYQSEYRRQKYHLKHEAGV